MTKLWLHVFSAMPETRCHPAGEAAYQAYSSQRYSSDWGLTQIFNGWIPVMCTQSCVIRTLVKDKNLYDAHIRLINPGWLADWSLGQSPIWPDCQSLPNYHTPENDAGTRMAVRWCFSFIFAGVQPSLTPLWWLLEASLGASYHISYGFWRRYQSLIICICSNIYVGCLTKKYPLVNLHSYWKWHIYSWFTHWSGDFP